MPDIATKSFEVKTLQISEADLEALLSGRTLNTKDISERLGISQQHAAKLLTTRFIPNAYLVGDTLRIDVVDFIVWLLEAKVSPSIKKSRGQSGARDNLQKVREREKSAKNYAHERSGGTVSHTKNPIQLYIAASEVVSFNSYAT